MGYLVNNCVEDGSIPMYLIKPLLCQHSIPYLIETGTASGDSVRKAAPYFKKISTIELISSRPIKLNAPSNVEFLIGSSVDILPELIDELIVLRNTEGVRTENNVKQQFVLFFLDAHYSGDTPNESDNHECPILEEIEIVSKYGDDAIIIIDDLRLFIGSVPYPLNPNQWCGITEIFEKLTELFPYHYTSIIDDYIVSIPIHVKEAWDENFRNTFSIRYPSAEDKLKMDAKNVYSAIKKYLQ